MMDDQTFQQALEEGLKGLDAGALRGLVSQLASGLPPAARANLLESLRKPVSAGDVSELHRRVDRFVEEMWSFTREIEEGDYSPGDTSGNTSPPPPPYVAKAAEMRELLEEAGRVFDGGFRKEVRAVYGKLFRVFSMEDALGGGIRPHHLAAAALEARNRWIRGVYEEETEGRRETPVLQALRWAVDKIRLRPWPRLADLLLVSRETLPGWGRFLAGFEELAGKAEKSDAAARHWFREAVFLRQGIDGLKRVCREQQAARPRVWLDLALALEKEERWEEALETAQEALRILPPGLPLRGELAGVMAKAVRNLAKPPEMLVSALWESFAAKPMLNRLLDLLEAVPPDQWDGWLPKAAQILSTGSEAIFSQPEVPRADFEEDGFDRPAPLSPVLLAHARLLAGQWLRALRGVEELPVLGWGGVSQAQSVAVQGIMALLHGDPDHASGNLRLFWRGFLQNHGGPDAETDPFELTKRLESAYRIQRERIHLLPSERDEVALLCREIGQRRVDAIVKGKHRKVYGRAARLACALVEMLAAGGWPTQAGVLLHHCEQGHAKRKDFQKELAEAKAEMETVLRLD